MSRIEQALEKAAASHTRSEPSGASTNTLTPQSPDPDTDTPPAPPPPTIEEQLDAPALNIHNPMLAALRENNSMVAEEYNKLRSVVVKLTATEGGKFLNTIMVSSTVCEEGKSLTAVNLAIAIAKSYDHTVLLVDTDFRRPSLHKLFGIKPEVGLIQCLRDNVPISQALIKTGIGKLVFLPAGGTVSKPVEILSSNRMKDVVQELKNRYPERYVIFDTPPVLPFADAQVLGPMVDGVLFVVREGRSKGQDIKKALQTLQGTYLLGTVYNDSNNEIKRSDYYYYQ